MYTIQLWLRHSNAYRHTDTIEFCTTQAHLNEYKGTNSFKINKQNECFEDDKSRQLEWEQIFMHHICDFCDLYTRTE